MTDDDRFPITCFSMHQGYIRLTQQGINDFSVHYGVQVDAELRYEQAARRLGEAIMHHAACESRLDNRDYDEIEIPDTDDIDPR
jgi:hypothetical protein